MKARLLAPLLLGAASLTTQAADLGALWPACKGWDSPTGLDQTYTPGDLDAREARAALERLAASEGKAADGEDVDIEVDSINRVQGYALRRSAESPTWDAPHHRAELGKFCRWLAVHTMPE